MNAKRCDRCGGYYSANTPVVSNENRDERVVFIGVTIHKVRQTRGSHGWSNNEATELYDLCDSCVDALTDFMSEPSLKEDTV